MTGIRSRDSRLGSLGLAVVAVAVMALVLSTPASIVGPATQAPHAAVARSSALPASTVGPPLPSNMSNASSIALFGVPTTEVNAGSPATIAWQALNATGAVANEFAVNGFLSVTIDANRSNAPAWVNVTALGPLVQEANGSFLVPSTAWGGGVLNLSVSVREAASVTVRLFGPYFPSAVASVGIEVLPDLDHLVLYDPEVLRASDPNETYWHVEDRFGDPAPGALLVVVLFTASWSDQSIVPVTETTSGATGAFVNYTAPASVNATFEIRDEAGDVVVGPVALLVPENSTASSTPPLSPTELAAVALVVVGGFVGLLALLVGDRLRLRRRPSSDDDEEELRRLAEGRATVVELVRRAGPLSIREIEAAWEPPPAPPALSDWVASLVADGTLSATLGEGGDARFSLAAPSTPAPKVTLDEEALERGIARRDAAVEEDHDAGESDEDERPP